MSTLQQNVTWTRKFDSSAGPLQWDYFFLLPPFLDLWFLGTDFSLLESFFFLFSETTFLGLFTDMSFFGWVAPKGVAARFPTTVLGNRPWFTKTVSGSFSDSKLQVVTTIVVSPSSYVVVPATNTQSPPIKPCLSKTTLYHGIKGPR